MDSTEQLRAKATTLRKQRQYQQALPYYNEIYKMTKNSPDRWDIWGLIISLNQTGKSERALQLCEQYYPQYSDFEYLRSQYACALYNCKLKKDDELITNWASIQAVFEQIAKLESNSGEPIYTRRAFITILEIYAKKGLWEKVIEWSTKFPREKLPSQARQFTPPGKKTIKLPSDRENWYLKVAKAQLETEQYQQCLALAQEGLGLFPDSVWLKRLYALALARNGVVDKAIQHFQEIIQGKKDWFLYHELAQLYMSQAHWEAAKQAITKAFPKIRNAPEQANFWELFCDAGLLLKSLGEIPLCYMHIAAAYQLVVSKGWRVNQKLSAAYSSIDRTTIPQTNTIKDLLDGIYAYWQGGTKQTLPTATGKIDRILPHGKAGFIQGDDGRSYYFKTFELKASVEPIKPGYRVSFYIKPDYDPVKKCDSVRAVNITLIR